VSRFCIFLPKLVGNVQAILWLLCAHDGLWALESTCRFHFEILVCTTPGRLLNSPFPLPGAVGLSDAELAQKLAEDMVRWHFLYELFNSEKQDIFKLVEMVICI